MARENESSCRGFLNLSPETSWRRIEDVFLAVFLREYLYLSRRCKTEGVRFELTLTRAGIGFAGAY